MYTIDPSSITVSGFSAGGFMAAQLAIAYSRTFSAFGIFAGGPYDCARSQDFITACMYNATPSIELPTANIKHWSAEGKIDLVDNLLSSRVYIQSGVRDEIIGLAVTRQLVSQMEHFVPRKNIRSVELAGAAHVLPTIFDVSNATAAQCNTSTQPFIANCGYDGAGEMLQWLYHDTLTDPFTDAHNRWEPKGTLHKYAQTDSLGAVGLADYGYYYTPSKCNSQAPRKLHVALHGCTMSYNDIGETFIRSSGYLEWAEANGMIVVFPQAKRDDILRPIWNGTEYPGGALACFDWTGWAGNDANWKGGKQTQAIINAIDWLAGPSNRGRGHSRTSDEL